MANISLTFGGPLLFPFVFFVLEGLLGHKLLFVVKTWPSENFLLSHFDTHTHTHTNRILSPPRFLQHCYAPYIF